MSYRENAKPDCPCDWCQSSVWQRQIAYVVRVFPRALLVVLAFGAVSTVVGILAGLAYGSAKQPDPLPDTSCHDSIDIVSSSSTPLQCSRGARLEVTSSLQPNYVTVICRCSPVADAGAAE